MSISVNGQSCVPPGFRFHPTEEELLGYYLRKKVSSEKIDLDVIRDIDLNKLEPWDLQDKCRIGSTPQNDLYFFSHKDKKYPTGTRTNRATTAGFWKATGRDKVIYSSARRIGLRKTLVFYKGRAPHGQKSEWIMHEFRLDDHSNVMPQSNICSSMGEATNQEDGWVVCRVFKKKNHDKVIDNPYNSSSGTKDAKTQVIHRGIGGGDDDDDEALDQILQYMCRSCKQESQGGSKKDVNPSNYTNSPVDAVFTCTGLHEMFMKLPALESPTTLPSPPAPKVLPLNHSWDDHTSYVSPAAIHAAADMDNGYHAGVGDWDAFDLQLLASQLNGSPRVTFHSSARPEALADDYRHVVGADSGDLWSLTRTASSSLLGRIGHASL